MSKGYNGWSNYETWIVSMWMTNDYGRDRYWNEVARECFDLSADEDSMTWSARRRFSDRLKDWVDEQADDSGVSGFLSDLLYAAVSAINWDEIAEQWVTDELAAEITKEMLAENGEDD